MRCTGALIDWGFCGANNTEADAYNKFSYTGEGANLVAGIESVSE